MHPCDVMFRWMVREWPCGRYRRRNQLPDLKDRTIDVETSFRLQQGSQSTGPAARRASIRSHLSTRQSQHRRSRVPLVATSGPSEPPSVIYKTCPRPSLPFIFFSCELSLQAVAIAAFSCRPYSSTLGFAQCQETQKPDKARHGPLSATPPPSSLPLPPASTTAIQQRAAVRV